MRSGRCAWRRRCADTLADGGKIGIITSRMGSVADNGSGGYYGYRASKAAVNAIGKSLAVDLRPRGIAVALLHPGYVATDMVGGSGDVTPAQAATQLVARLDALTLDAERQLLARQRQRVAVVTLAWEFCGSDVSRD